MLPDQELTAILADATDPRDAARQLIDAANQAGGEDNLTAVVIATPAAAQPPG